MSGRILVLCPHPERVAPAQRLKFEQYYPSWRAAGFEVDVRPFWDDRTHRILYKAGHEPAKVAGVASGFLRRVKDALDARKADLVYLHLEAAPLGPAIFERSIDSAGVPIVYDVDDLVYLPHASKTHSFMRWIRNHEKIPELMRIARHVIVCTDHLKEFALQQNPNVTNISSTIDTDSYAPRPHRQRTKGVVIGWSGSFSTAPYLHLLDDVLRELQQTDNVEVRVIGEPSFSIPGVRLEALPWKLETEVASLSEIDIGVYPLPNEEWVLGKSGLKALQYMALEIPTVAQRIGMNLEIIEEEKNGFLAGSPEEWINKLRRLVRDPELRRRVGVEARKTVLARYSVRANAPTYLSILERALGRA